MSELISSIPTSWPSIRFVLRRRDDGQFEFVEQSRRESAVAWSDNYRSGLYGDAASAERDMKAYAAEYEKQ